MPQPKRLKLLVAEDDPKTAALYRKFLSPELFEVSFVEDGEAAILAYDQEKPQIVMLDLVLPVRDGVSVLEHIRERRGDRATSVIIATARHREELRNRCAELSVQGVLTKPFDLRTINHSILEFHSYQGVGLDLDYDLPDPRKIRLLIAEDDKKLALVYERFLPADLFQVRIEPDGLKALAAYHAFKPEIVILDLILPGMSGLKILEEIRENLGDFQVSVIIATAERKVDAVKQCASFDIQGYLLKPLDVKTLGRTILGHHKRHLMDLRRKGWIMDPAEI